MFKTKHSIIQFSSEDPDTQPHMCLVCGLEIENPAYWRYSICENCMTPIEKKDVKS